MAMIYRKDIEDMVIDITKPLIEAAVIKGQIHLLSIIMTNERFADLGYLQVVHKNLTKQLDHIATTERTPDMRHILDVMDGPGTADTLLGEREVSHETLLEFVKDLRDFINAWHHLTADDLQAILDEWNNDELTQLFKEAR